MVQKIIKQTQKNLAINLRKRGFSYSEILKRVPVAKSTLSLWLREIGLSKQQTQRLTKKKLDAALRGAQKRRQQRLALMKHILDESRKEIGVITKRELWLFGIALYWAEGSKEKDYHPGSGVQFTNSDPRMVKLFLEWLVKICHVAKNTISFDIFIHQNSKKNLRKIIDYWSKEIHFPVVYFKHIYLKKNIIKTHRYNVGNSYYGVVKVKVKASSNLNRRIAGWIEGVLKSH